MLFLFRFIVAIALFCVAKPEHIQAMLPEEAKAFKEEVQHLSAAGFIQTQDALRDVFQENFAPYLEPNEITAALKCIDYIDLLRNYYPFADGVYAPDFDDSDAFSTVPSEQDINWLLFDQTFFLDQNTLVGSSSVVFYKLISPSVEGETCVALMGLGYREGDTNVLKGVRYGLHAIPPSMSQNTIGSSEWMKDLTDMMIDRITSSWVFEGS